MRTRLLQATGLGLLLLHAMPAQAHGDLVILYVMAGGVLAQLVLLPCLTVATIMWLLGAARDRSHQNE